MCKHGSKYWIVVVDYYRDDSMALIYPGLLDDSVIINGDIGSQQSSNNHGDLTNHVYISM